MTEQENSVQEQEMMEQETQEASEPKAIHHQTKHGADLAIAKQQISQESYRAVVEGRIDLAEAKELGRSAGPDGPVGKVTAKADRSRECACECGQLTKGGVWIPGHDARLPGLVLRAVQGEIELTDEQKEHAEKRDLFTKAEAKIAAKLAKDEARAAKQAGREAKRQEKIAVKTEKQQEK